VQLLVNEQYIDSIMHGATIKIVCRVYILSLSCVDRGRVNGQTAVL